MSISAVRQFGIFFDKYYWQTAVLIAKNGLARMYRNSFLGILWTLFQPLTMVMIYATMMPMIMRSPVTNYSLYVIISLPVWGFFSAALVGSSQSILSNGETLKRCMVSSSVFPIADVLRHSYTFFISFTTIYIVALLLGLTTFDGLILLVPLYFIPILMIIGSIAISIAFIAPYVRDIGELTSVSMMMLFWLTPTVYQISMLPPKAQFWMRFNPFFIMMHPIQMLAYEHVVPSINDLEHLIGLTIISIVFGFFIFRIFRRNYVYYL